MKNYSKEEDSKLYEFFDGLKKSINETSIKDFYLSACDIIKYVIEIGAAYAGIKLEKKGLWFLKKTTNLSDYLANNEVKKYLNVLGVNVYSCNKIKETSDNAIKNEDEIFDLNEIYENTNFIIDLVMKIYDDVYGETAPKKENFNDAIVVIEKINAKYENNEDIIDTDLTIIADNKYDEKSEQDTVKAEINSIIDDGYISFDEQLDATPRLPVCICLDYSGSMRGSKFEKMKTGLKMFCDAIMNDPKSKRSAEISIITFNDECKIFRKFARLDNPIVLNGTEPKYGTKVSPAIECALDMLEKRKDEYRSKGMEYYQPWLVIISDGLPADNCELVKEKVLELERNKKLVVLSFPILTNGAASEKNEKTLKFMDGFSANKSLPLDSEKIKEFFVWLSRSIHVSVRKGKADFSTTTSDFRAENK